MIQLFSYWKTPASKKSWLILLLIITLNISTVYFMVLMAKWNALFFDALSQVDGQAFQQSLRLFIGLVGISVLIVMYKRYFSQMLQIQWREWLTVHYFNDWLNQTQYYYFAEKFPLIDNPDQRLSNDIRDFSKDTIDLFLGFIHSLITLVSFISMLWIAGGALAIQINGETWHIAGYMVWVAVIYALLGSLISHFIAKKLNPLNYQQQQYEANFRHQLIQTTEQPDSLALAQAEPWHRQQLNHQFDKICQNWWQIMVYNKRLEGFSSLYNRFSLVVPHLAVAPQYFAGKLTMGGLMQMASAFAYVQQALSWFVDAYAKLVVWRATADRLLEFKQAMTTLENTRLPLQIKYHQQAHWEINQLEIKTTEQTVLFKINQLKLEKGGVYQIKGGSGAGKSTFYKTLAGISAYSKGEIKKPQGLILYFESQPYLMNMTIAQYLNHNKAIKNSLKAVGLAQYSPENATQNLSKGECQRLIFAKVLLQRPQWVIFDESFNALPQAEINQILSLIKKDNPDLGILFSSHFEWDWKIKITQTLIIEAGDLKRITG